MQDLCNHHCAIQVRLIHVPYSSGQGQGPIHNFLYSHQNINILSRCRLLEERPNTEIAQLVILSSIHYYTLANEVNLGNGNWV